MKAYSSLDELESAVGDELGPTNWLQIGQERVDGFAGATGDRQWIHIDPERAANGPFGGTIARGLVTLALLPRFMYELYRMVSNAMAINYGFNKVKFVTPVPVGAMVPASSTIQQVNRLDDAVQAPLGTTIEVDGAENPAAAIESIVRYVG